MGNEPLLRHLLPTTVVGSYSVPEWLERLKTECYQRRISSAHLAEIHEVAIKAAIKDQEQAGIDIVSDGELRRDNDIDYFLARIPGVLIERRAKADYYDYYDAEVAAELPEDERASLGLADDYSFTSGLTDRPVKFSFTGPFSLSRRISGAGYRDPADLVRALARRLNREARSLAAAGAGFLQIDEPFLAGYPALLGGPLRLPVPGGAAGAGRPAGARVRPQGPRRPAPDQGLRLAVRARPRRDRREVARGGDPRVGSGADQVGA